MSLMVFQSTDSYLPFRVSRTYCNRLENSAEVNEMSNIQVSKYYITAKILLGYSYNIKAVVESENVWRSWGRSRSFLIQLHNLVQTQFLFFEILDFYDYISNLVNYTLDASEL